MLRKLYERTMMETILVTGGAGYIGSAAVRALIEKGHDVVIVDNLSNGKKKFIDSRAKFYEVDLVDKENLAKVFSENKIDAVMHFAGYKAVDESMENAVKYSDNITGTVNLLNMMVKYKVNKIIYSSSAAVYGIPKEFLVDENCALSTINYYGFTKLASEEMIVWYSRIHEFKYISLRYFNVAGDAGLNYTDPDAKNVMSIIMEVLAGKRDKFVIYGDDYDTKDGTCIRDYIDINDLVDAHILALDAGENGVINLGTSTGVSVKELVDMTMEVTGKKLNYEVGPSREGDPAGFVASNEKAKKVLGWVPKRGIREMIKTTYRAYFG